ncbi:hypothetical protein [Haloferula sp. BvORR071]|uniref:hypothetical protein n=1 Tax=Haloferula sp. BvORR071 TaxID=1396141 RepID=UPI0005505FA1|nr:hypothetical protein [Haloferula sp. BvORR071]
MKALLPLFASGLITGGAVAWQKNRPPAVVPGVASAPQSPVSKAPPKKWEVRNFIDLINDAPELDESSNFLAPQLTDWSDAELQKALNEALASPDCVLDGSSSKILARMLVAEWMRRDLTSALAWFEAIPSETMRSELASAVSFYWPLDKAEEGLAYAVTHPEFFAGNGGTHAWKIVHRALESAAKRGPEAVVACLATVRESKLPISGGDLQFPANFDFQTLANSQEVEELWKKGRGIFFAEAWLKQDRNAAFDCIAAASKNPAAQLLTLNSVLPAAEVTERTTLLAGWIDGADEAQREERIEDILKSCLVRPDALETLGKTLKDPADRDQIHSGALRGIRTIGAKTAFAHLEAYGDGAQRLDLLETFEPLPPLLMPRGRMTAEEVSSLREKLGSWGASPERTENIITRLQGILK